MLTLLLLAPIFSDLPKPVLAALIIDAQGSSTLEAGGDRIVDNPRS